MKKLILISILPIVFGVCKIHKKEEKSDEKVFFLSEYYSKFKYNDLKEFKFKKYEIDSNLEKIDSITWKKIWQDSLEFSNEDKCFFFKIIRIKIFQLQSKIIILPK